MKRIKTIFIFFILSFNFKVFPQNSLDKPFNKCFEIPRKFGEQTIVASDNENVNSILSFWENSLTSKNPFSKELNWTTDFKGKSKQPISIINDKILFITNSPEQSDSTAIKSSLNAIGLKTGLFKWQKEIEADSQIIGSNSNQQLIIKNGSASIQTINVESGETIASINIDENILSFLNLENERPFAPKESDTVSIYLGKEQIIREISDADSLTSLKILNEKKLVYGTSNGKIISFIRNPNHISWIFQAGAKISDILIIRNTIIAISLDNFIYCLSEKTGKLRWKQRAGSRLDIKPILGDQSILVGSSSEKSIRFFELKTGKLINLISFGNSETDILENFVFAGKYLVVQTSKELIWLSTESCK